MLRCDGYGAIRQGGRDTTECPGCELCSRPEGSSDGTRSVAYVGGKGYLHTDGTWRSVTGRVLGRASDREMLEHGGRSPATRAA